MIVCYGFIVEISEIGCYGRLSCLIAGCSGYVRCDLFGFGLIVVYACCWLVVMRCGLCYYDMLLGSCTLCLVGVERCWSLF